MDIKEAMKFAQNSFDNPLSRDAFQHNLCEIRQDVLEELIKAAQYHPSLRYVIDTVGTAMMHEPSSGIQGEWIKWFRNHTNVVSLETANNARIARTNGRISDDELRGMICR